MPVAPGILPWPGPGLRPPRPPSASLGLALTSVPFAGSCQGLLLLSPCPPLLPRARVAPLCCSSCLSSLVLLPVSDLHRVSCPWRLGAEQGRGWQSCGGHAGGRVPSASWGEDQPSGCWVGASLGATDTHLPRGPSLTELLPRRLEGRVSGGWRGGGDGVSVPCAGLLGTSLGHPCPPGPHAKDSCCLVISPAPSTAPTPHPCSLPLRGTRDRSLSLASGLSGASCAGPRSRGCPALAGSATAGDVSSRPVGGRAHRVSAGHSSLTLTWE